MSPTSTQQVRIKLAASRCIVEFEKRHDATDITDFCSRQLVMDLLQTCYGETGVTDFGVKSTQPTSSSVSPLHAPTPRITRRLVVDVHTLSDRTQAHDVIMFPVIPYRDVITTTWFHVFVLFFNLLLSHIFLRQLQMTTSFRFYF